MPEREAVQILDVVDTGDGVRLRLNTEHFNILNKDQQFYIIATTVQGARVLGSLPIPEPPAEDTENSDASEADPVPEELEGTGDVEPAHV